MLHFHCFSSQHCTSHMQYINISLFIFGCRSEAEAHLVYKDLFHHFSLSAVQLCVYVSQLPADTQSNCVSSLLDSQPVYPITAVLCESTFPYGTSLCQFDLDSILLSSTRLSVYLPRTSRSQQWVHVLCCLASKFRFLPVIYFHFIRAVVLTCGVLKTTPKQIPVNLSAREY